MGKVTEINQDNFAEFVATGVCLIDYWATWCGPCKMIAPTVEQLANDLDGKVKVGKVDVDQSRELAKNAEVSAIPNLCIYVDGVLRDRIIGVQTADEISKTLSKYL